ncbi:MAG: sortase [Chloroflexota bacterium]
MSRRTPSWGTLALGIALGVIGLACVAGGLALLGWRLLAPDDAVIVPPHLFGTPEPTPTPGLLGTALPAPPLPGALTQVVILPVSEPPTPTATAVPTETVAPSDTPAPSPTAPSPAAPSPTAPLRETQTPAPSPTPAFAPSATPTMTETAPPLTVTSIPTLLPTASPTPISGAPPTHIRITAIGLDAPVVPVGQHAVTLDGELFSQWDVPPARAAGWHQTSAPLGAPGNTVLNGHHNVYGEVFRYLSALKPGDWIALDSGDRRYYYVVVQTMTLAEEGQPLAVRAENARWILPTADERVTLVTCWPSYANTHRLVVIALPLWDVIPPAGIP